MHATLTLARMRARAHTHTFRCVISTGSGGGAIVPADFLLPRRPRENRVITAIPTRLPCHLQPPERRGGVPRGLPLSRSPTPTFLPRFLPITRATLDRRSSSLSFVCQLLVPGSVANQL